MHTSPLILVPCKQGVKKSCDLLREALQRAIDGRPDVSIAEVDSPDLADAHVVALDASRDCKASEILKARRVKVQTTVYVPDLLASRRLPDPRVPLTAQWPALVNALSEALTEQVNTLLGDRLHEQEYFTAIAPVAERYRIECAATQAAGEPSETVPRPPDAQRERLVLASNRFRNQFMRCDEITPPPWLATLHDVFQDACMCMVYALQHWDRSEWRKAADYIEQAEHQAGPLLRRIKDE